MKTFQVSEVEKFTKVLDGESEYPCVACAHVFRSPGPGSRAQCPKCGYPQNSAFKGRLPSARERWYAAQHDRRFLAWVQRMLDAARLARDREVLVRCVDEDRDHGEPMLPRDDEKDAVQRLERAGFVIVDASGAYAPTDKGRRACYSESLYERDQR